MVQSFYTMNVKRMKQLMIKIGMHITAIVRNRKVATKLWMIVAPTFLMTVIILIQMGVQTSNASKRSEDTYYNLPSQRNMLQVPKKLRLLLSKY